jgi:predicted nucleic acid-binding protein
MFTSYLLDSNILIGYLNGDTKIIDWVISQKIDDAFLYISFITPIELLSLKTLKDSDVDGIEKFLGTFYEVPANKEITQLAAALRRKGVVTLGDAIVTATAISKKCTLVTNDKDLVKKVNKFVTVVSI